MKLHSTILRRQKNKLSAKVSRERKAAEHENMQAMIIKQDTEIQMLVQKAIGMQTKINYLESIISSKFISGDTQTCKDRDQELTVATRDDIYNSILPKTEEESQEQHNIDCIFCSENASSLCDGMSTHYERFAGGDDLDVDIVEDIDSDRTNRLFDIDNMHLDTLS